MGPPAGRPAEQSTAADARPPASAGHRKPVRLLALAASNQRANWRLGGTDSAPPAPPGAGRRIFTGLCIGRSPDRRHGPAADCTGTAAVQRRISAGGAAEVRERAVGGGLSEGRCQRSTPLPSLLLLLCALASSTVQLVLSGRYLHSAPSSAGPARPFPVPRQQKASVYLTWNQRDDANGAPSTREASSPGSARSGRRNHQQARGQQQQQQQQQQRQRQSG